MHMESPSRLHIFFVLRIFSQRFLDCPMAANWTRFDAYAQRIRSITFDDTSPWAGWKNWAVKFNVLAEISLYHHRGRISPPNVRKLTWASEYHDSAMSALPFVSKSLAHLHLSLGEDVEDKTTEKLIHFILQRPINLKSFSFESAISAENISHDLIQLISNSPQLESVTLPRYYQTQTIVDTLGHLYELKTLQVSHKWYQPYNSQGQAMSLLNGRFPKLDAIEIDAPIPTITQILPHSQMAAKLRDLTISCAHLNNTVDVAALATVVAQCCPGIQALSFNFRPSTPAPTTVDLPSTVFQPVLSCHNLQEFRIYLGKPFTITEHDLQEMARAWPNLRVLVLSPERGQQASAGLSWNVFPVIAGLFTNLEELSAYFSSTDIVSFAGDILPPVELLSLRKLGVGMSGIPNDHTALGFLIGAYCRLPISISNEPSVWERMLGERAIDGQWQGVENVARRVQQVKKEIRKRWRFRGSGEDN